MKLRDPSLLPALLLFLFGGLALAQVPLPPISSAMSDGSRIVVNGKPFFPILLYDVPTDAESLQKFRAHGFNMVTVSKTEHAEAARAAGLYSAAHGRKLTGFESILLGIGIDSPVIELKPPLLENLKADLEKTRAAVPDRPVMHAIGYWLNEPAGVVANTLPPPEKYELVVQAIDVAAPYLYPVPYQPVGTVADAVARASAASGGKKPLLPILQIFRWTATDRYPTVAELRCMTYLSLVHGATGIGYYSYNTVTGKKGTTFEQEQPELWASLKPLTGELGQIGPFLIESTPNPSITLKGGSSGVHLRAASRGTSHIVLLANPTDTAREVALTFTALPDGIWKRIGEGAPLAVEGGGATLKLEPHGTAAFQK